MAVIAQDVMLGHKDLMRAIKFNISIKDPVFIWGPPGSGKTEGMEALADEIDFDMRSAFMETHPEFSRMKNRPFDEFHAFISSNTNRMYHFVVVSMSRLDSVDLRGLPTFSDDKRAVIWALPKFLPQGSDFKGLLFFDELNTADPVNLPPCYQLIQSRRLDEYFLPDGVDIAAAGNRKSDKGVTFDLPSPLADRMTHYELDVRSDDWMEYAAQHGHHPDIVAFIGSYPAMLSSYEQIGKEVVFRSPRSWSVASKQYSDESFSKLSREIQKAILAGRVGKEGQQEFFNFLDFARNLPAPDSILLGELTECCLETSNELFAVSVRLNSRFKEYSSLWQAGKLSDDEFDKVTNNYFGYIMTYKKRDKALAAFIQSQRMYAVRLNMKQADRAPHFRAFMKENADVVNNAMKGI